MMKRLANQTVSFLGLLVCLAVTGSTSLAGMTPVSRISQAIDEKNLVELSGNVHPLARAQFDRGAVDDSLPLEHLMLLLKRSPGQEQALETRISALYDPHSADYHRWLTAHEFGESYGPSKQDLAQVTKWLESRGFTVNVVYPSGTVIDVSG